MPLALGWLIGDDSARLKERRERQQREEATLEMLLRKQKEDK